MSQYCQPSDLTLYAINPLALNGVSLLSQNAACIQASSEADGYLNDRYPPPYSPPFPTALIINVAYIAVYRLMTARGFSLEGDNNQIRDNYWSATFNPHTGVLGWLSRVKRQEISIPDLIFPQPTYPTFAIPAVRTGGVRARPVRGW